MVICDLLILPTRTDEKHSRAQKVLELYKSGGIGAVLISGGHNGFSISKAIESEAEVEANYLNQYGIPANKLYLDDRSLETLGNFAFPYGLPLQENTTLLSASSVGVVSEEFHLARCMHHATTLLPASVRITPFAVPNTYKPSRTERLYQKCFMSYVDSFVSSPEQAVRFLQIEHPYYQPGWFDKPLLHRKAQLALTLLAWVAQPQHN